jgi:hypothetical protein
MVTENSQNPQLKLMVRGDILRNIFDSSGYPSSESEDTIKYIQSLNLPTDKFATFLLYLDKGNVFGSIFPNTIGELSRAYNHDVKLALLQRNKALLTLLIDQYVNPFPEMDTKDLTEQQRTILSDKRQKELNDIIAILNIIENHGMKEYYSHKELYPVKDNDLVDIKSARDDRKGSKVPIVHRVKRIDLVRSLCGSCVNPCTKKDLSVSEVERLKSQLSTEIALYNAYLSLIINFQAS